MADWEAEKRMASELAKLGREVKRLAEDIRGTAIPPRNPAQGPAFPTEPERRLRSVVSTADDSRKKPAKSTGRRRSRHDK